MLSSGAELFAAAACLLYRLKNSCSFSSGTLLAIGVICASRFAAIVFETVTVTVVNGVVRTSELVVSVIVETTVTVLRSVSGIGDHPGRTKTYLIGV